MLDSERTVHAVAADIDLDMAIALGLEVVAECGTTFVPKYGPGESVHFPDCLTCHPRSRRSHGKHRTPVHIRATFPHYVYRLFNADGDLLYVGCTYNPPTRFRSHKVETKWFKDVASTRLTVFPNRRKALDMERVAIENEDPIHNRQFKRVPA